MSLNLYLRNLRKQKRGSLRRVCSDGVLADMPGQLEEQASVHRWTRLRGLLHCPQGVLSSTRSYVHEDTLYLQQSIARSAPQGAHARWPLVPELTLSNLAQRVSHECILVKLQDLWVGPEQVLSKKKKDKEAEFHKLRSANKLETDHDHLCQIYTINFIGCRG